MFGVSNSASKSFSLANIIEEQLSNITLGGANQLHLDSDSNVLSALEDSQSESSSHSDLEARSTPTGGLIKGAVSSFLDDASGGATPPLSVPPLDVDKVVDKLAVAEVRWFYKESGSKNWTAFGGFDSLSIETAFSKLPPDQQGPRKSSPKTDSATGSLVEDVNVTSPSTSSNSSSTTPQGTASDSPRVLVFGGLFELDFPSRTCSSIYWPGERFIVTRGTWFYESWQPLEEEAADLIERDHLATFLGKKPVDFPHEAKPLHTQSLLDFNVDWYSINEVYVYSRGTPSKLVRSFTKKLGYFQRSGGTRVLRGYRIPATGEDKHKDISHLVFVVHGIGQKMNIGAQIFRNTSVIRERVTNLKEKYFPDSNQRAEFFPVEWRSSLVLDGGVVDAITPPHVKLLRQVLNTSAMDIMYYTSPIYCVEIQEGVAAEMNRLYSMFCERNPHIKPKVSVIAHSLGAVICYDIITGYVPLGSFPGSSSHTPGTTRLNFELDNFFCLGSPLAVFLALRSKKGEHGYHLFPPSLCNRLYNVYHLTDPVAYRLEPLIVRDYAKIAPLPLHPCNAVRPTPYQDLPMELEDLESFSINSTCAPPPPVCNSSSSSTSTNAATGPCVSGTVNSASETSNTCSPTDTPSKEKGWSIWTLWKQKNAESGSQQFVDSPSEGLEHRLDYVLTSGAAGPLVVRSVFVSHTAYWSSNDVAFFVLTRIFPELEEELCSEERTGSTKARRSRKRRRSAIIRRKRKFNATFLYKLRGTSRKLQNQTEHSKDDDKV